VSQVISPTEDPAWIPARGFNVVSTPTVSIVWLQNVNVIPVSLALAACLMIPVMGLTAMVRVDVSQIEVKHAVTVKLAITLRGYIVSLMKVPVMAKNAAVVENAWRSPAAEEQSRSAPVSLALPPQTQQVWIV